MYVILSLIGLVIQFGASTGGQVPNGPNLLLESGALALILYAVHRLSSQ